MGVKNQLNLAMHYISMLLLPAKSIFLSFSPFSDLLHRPKSVLVLCLLSATTQATLTNLTANLAKLRSEIFYCQYFSHQMVLQTFPSKLYLVAKLVSSIKIVLPPSERPNVFCRIVNSRTFFFQNKMEFNQIFNQIRSAYYVYLGMTDHHCVTYNYISTCHSEH